MQSTTQTYYSNGKLLLTGEYLVMKGAKAIAFPTKYGQSLEVKSGNRKSNEIRWKAYEPDGLWFEAVLSTDTFEILSTNDTKAAGYLSFILTSAKKLYTSFPLETANEIIIDTHTDFPINWGLGTSSTLIANIAQWAGIAPFDLHHAVSKGSGYDIACATAKSPITYQLCSGKPEVEPIQFQKSFLDNLWFVYSGKKKRTEEHIQQFLSATTDYTEEIKTVNKLSSAILKTTSLETFIELLKEHEKCIGDVLKWKPIGEDLFICFNGAVKSLGAWGGDFLLIASEEKESYVRAFFEQNGLSCIIPYKEMVY